MCDTLNMFTSIEHIECTDQDRTTLPFLIGQVINQDGDVLSSVAKSALCKSPLTNAGFFITPVFRETFARQDELIGYMIYLNVPACVVGNNALLQVLVYYACLIALYFLKLWLIQSGCSVNIVDQLDLDHSEIHFVALTYLLECEDHTAAKAFNLKIERYGDATLNTKASNPKQKKPVSTYSAAGLMTATYTKHRLLEGKSYVKAGPTPKSFETFHSPQVKQAVYAESGTKVRVESNANHKRLCAQGYEKPLAWKNKAKAAEAYQLAFKELSDYLRVSENLRSKRPKPEQIEGKLTITEQSILLAYFDGIDPKTHPTMLGKSAQYFSSVKRSIESKLRIDMTIPWSVHSSQISPDLPNWFQCPAEYEAPDHLADHCFVRETVKAKLKQLRALLSTTRAASLPLLQVTPTKQAVISANGSSNGAKTTAKSKSKSKARFKTVTTGKRHFKSIRQGDDE